MALQHMMMVMGDDRPFHVRIAAAWHTYNNGNSQQTIPAAAGAVGDMLFVNTWNWSGENVAPVGGSGWDELTTQAGAGSAIYMRQMDGTSADDFVTPAHSAGTVGGSQMIAMRTPFSNGLQIHANGNTYPGSPNALFKYPGMVVGGSPLSEWSLILSHSLRRIATVEAITYNIDTGANFIDGTYFDDGAGTYMNAWCFQFDYEETLFSSGSYGQAPSSTSPLYGATTRLKENP